MINHALKEAVSSRILPRVQTPAQYIGGEWNSVVKDSGSVRGRLCLCFPDTYSIGMSHYGLQVLYALINARPDWACERAFAPWIDMEQRLREERLPLFSLETYTPLREFDIVGFSLQHDLCYTNVLTMLDLGGIPLHAEQRAADDPLVIAGGPCAWNPEPMAEFIDAFVIGDGEVALPAVCDAWIDSAGRGLTRSERLLRLAASLPFVYVPRFYEAVAAPAEPGCVRRILCEAPEQIVPAVLENLDSVPLPTAPIVPWVETVQDRIALEIMRGCPWRCRFCQSTSIKRPLRFRSVESIVEGAKAAYRNTGHNEISLLSLSSSDYRGFDVLMQRMQSEFRPLHVAVSLPSLRVNEQLRSAAELLNTDRHGGLTLAPEAAREAMRERLGKRITDDDLYSGCRKAFELGFSRVKLYFMCGLPGEQPEDLDGIIEMSENVSRLGKEVSGRFAVVVANVSNLVPKPHTPLQWEPMQTREYLTAAKRQLLSRLRHRTVQLKCHDVETSLLEGVCCRGDRRLARAIEAAWRAGSRFDAWSEQLQASRWWEMIATAGIDVNQILHTRWPTDARFPWDHITIRQGRDYLVRECCAMQAASCHNEPLPNDHRDQ